MSPGPRAKRKIPWPIVNEDPRDRNNFRITKRDPRRWIVIGAVEGKKRRICVRARTDPPPLRTCTRAARCCTSSRSGRGERTRPCRGVCPLRMATKLRQKKKRSGTGGEAEEGRRIEEEGESWGTISKKIGRLKKEGKKNERNSV